MIFLRSKGRFVATDLQIAAVRGDADEVRAILDRLRKQSLISGGDLRVHLSAGYDLFTSDCPLRLAIRRGHSEVVRALIEGGRM